MTAQQLLNYNKVAVQINVFPIYPTNNRDQSASLHYYHKV